MQSNIEKSASIQWLAPEYQHQHKSVDWYWAAGIIILSVAVASFFMSNILFGIFILMAGALIFLFANRAPENIRMEVSEEGIAVGSAVLPWNRLKRFSVVSRDHGRVLLVESDQPLHRVVSLPLGEVDEYAVRDLIDDHIPEDPKLVEGLSERVFGYFGF